MPGGKSASVLEHARAKENVPSVPGFLIGALHLGHAETGGLAGLSDREWHDGLHFAHRNMIGLDLLRAAGDAMPCWVREELEGCARRNAERARRVGEIHREIQERLGERGVPFVALKGVAHAGLFGSTAEDRPQCDIDIYVPPERAGEARDIFLEWGYEPIGGMEAFPTDHLPAMIRKTGWEWHGDYFDVDMPFPVEIHVQFWNEELERLPAPGIERFWDRRERRDVGGLELPVLAPADALGYASLHMLKHLLQGTLRACHVLEIARFLEAHADDEGLWREWQHTHDPQMRRLEAVAFRLAQHWFGCEMSEAAEQEIGALPQAVRAWFDQFGWSPLVRPFRPNKDELWLHLNLLESKRDAVAVARRRLLPLQLPGPVSGVCVPESQMTLQRRVEHQMHRAAYTAGRVRHHAVSLPRVAFSGARWWLGTRFWIFLAAAALFNFGLFVFVLLYNLFLLDLGFREDFIGSLSSASTIGTMAGTLPAAWVMRRLGLRLSLVGAVTAAVVTVILRALVRGPAALMVLAFVWGLVFAVWAVLIAPLIAGAVPEERRPAAFSVFFGCMLAVGIAGNWIGGRIPGWVHGKQPALLVAGGIVIAALIPALRLRLPPPVPGPGRIWPRGPFLKRYLSAYAVWQLATGAFNPFASVYFARLGLTAARIGSLFSGAQIAQLGAMLAAPVVIRRFGVVRAIVWMIAGTALGLGGMAMGAGALAAAMPAYAWYMSLQWMSEPGLNTLLMNQVTEEERSGASSLNYLVGFAAQAIAAYAAGHMVAKGGYAPVLKSAAAMAVVAAVLFAVLIRPENPARRSASAPE